MKNDYRLIKLWFVLFLLQNATICIGFSVYSTHVVSDTLSELLKQPDQFADFTALGCLMSKFSNF